jgi:rhodanese-related sulfurtransferase
LHEAFESLPDETILYPTHGGGSFCSTGSSSERTSTLGRERQANPLLHLDDEDDFVRWFPSTFPGAPDYFFRMRAFNQKGPRLRDEIVRPSPLSSKQFSEARRNALVVDLRSTEVYSEGHIPKSLNVTFRPSYATWLGWLVPEGTPLLFVLGDADLEAVLDESMLVGYEDFTGYLDGDIETWRNAGFEIARTELVAAGVAHEVIREGAVALDVREPSEFAGGHIEKALHIPLGELPGRLSEVPQGSPILAYCGLGERASTAASILERGGHKRLFNLAGGMQAWRSSAERS